MQISKSKRNQLRALFQENLNKSKTQNKINKLISQKQKGMDNNFLSKNDVMITEQRTVVSKFNKYFINVAQNLKYLQEKVIVSFKITYLKNPNENSLVFFSKKQKQIKFTNYFRKQLNIKKAQAMFAEGYKVSPEKTVPPGTVF